MESPFAPILAIAELMQSFPDPWFIAGGWAIDLFLGQVTRPHHDIEIGIYRRDQPALHSYLSNYTLEKCVPGVQGAQWMTWPRGEELRLPIHQIRATGTYVADQQFEFLLNECDGPHWASRRHAGLLVPTEKVTRQSVLNIPILAPEIQLLFKAKQTRPKDQSDFEKTIPRLDPSAIAWLAEALRRYHADHPWLKALSPD